MLITQSLHVVTWFTGEHLSALFTVSIKDPITFLFTLPGTGQMPAKMFFDTIRILFETRILDFDAYPLPA
jgi:hypothetical protein